jgi:hypothetical protein
MYRHGHISSRNLVLEGSVCFDPISWYAVVPGSSLETSPPPLDISATPLPTACLRFRRRMNHAIPATAMITSKATPIPIPAFAPVLIPACVSCEDGEGLESPVAEFGRSVAVELDAEVEVELEMEDVELVTLATPITALIFVPSPSLQHVVFEPPQHQLPSLHCINGTLSDASPPFYTDGRLECARSDRSGGGGKCLQRNWCTDSRGRGGSSMLDLCRIRASTMAGCRMGYCSDRVRLACIDRLRFSDLLLSTGGRLGVSVFS